MPERVLLIEDDERLATALRIRLEIADFAVAHALSASEGLTAVRQFLPQIIVLDIRMPDMDGCEACRLIRAEHPAIPIVIVSSCDRQQWARLAEAAGADEYLSRPCEPQKIISTLRRLINQSRAVAPRACATSTPFGDGGLG